jgi:transposase
LDLTQEPTQNKGGHPIMFYIGIDLHKKFSQVTVMNEQGNISQRKKLYHNDLESLKSYLSSFNHRAQATIEATRNWSWFYDLLEEAGINTKLAHPLKTRAIAEARIKTDKLDSATLAHLDRADLIAQAYVPVPPIRQQRELLRYRQSLVRIRSAIKNKIHALIDKQGVFPPAFTDLFGGKGLCFLKEVKLSKIQRQNLDGYLNLLEQFNQLIKEASKRIRKSVKELPQAKLLMTIPGVSFLTSHLLLAEIGDISRFPSAGKLCSYAGLVPSVHQSGQQCYHGRITKQGNAYIRWAMIEVAQTAIRYDTTLGRWHLKLSVKRGKNKATVACARKLLVAIYHMLQKNQPYKNQRLSG